MIRYTLCSQASDKDTFNTFMEGFSDYVVKVELSIEFFLHHFFGAEGNDRELSWLALDGEKPVGLVLGGIRQFDGLKTLRCGTMCVVPDYRKQGVAAGLLQKHRETALSHQCEQMFLECITGNDRALNFYRKHGYEKVYDLSYFSCDEPDSIFSGKPDGLEPLTMEELTDLRRSSDLHINWQNEVDYIAMNGNDIWGIKNRGRAVAAIAFKETRIQFLYVDEVHRKKGLGRILVGKAAEGREKLTASFPNNSQLTGFYKKLGFEREQISQVEMYRRPD